LYWLLKNNLPVILVMMAAYARLDAFRKCNTEADMNVSHAVLSHVIGRIYDCVVDPGAWNDALDEIQAVIGSANAALSLFDKRSGTEIISIMRNFDPIWAAALPQFVPEFFEPLILRPALLEIEAAVYSRDSDPITEAKIARYRREWAEPQGLSYAIGITLIIDDDTIATFGAGRWLRDGDYQPQEIRFAELIAPHLRRAVTISNVLNAANVRAQLLGAALDALPTGVAIVDGSSRLIHANNAAMEIFDRGDALRLEGDMVAARGKAARASLKSSVSIAAADESQLPGTGRGIRLGDIDTRSSLAHVLPLSGGERQQIRDGAAAILVKDRPSAANDHISVFAGAFDLTRAETNVLAHLLNGAKPERIAHALEISENTVRTHIRALFAKTDTKRLHQLVAFAHQLMP
jgi:DNA-binding CsgD family transcriptional regulator